MAHREEINPPDVSPDLNHEEGTSGEASCSGLHPNAADFIHKIVGRDIGLDDVSQFAAEQFAASLVGLYQGLRSRVPKKYQEIDRINGELVQDYAKGVPTDMLLEEYSLNEPLLFARMRAVTDYLRDYGNRGPGGLFEHMLDGYRGWEPAFRTLGPVTGKEQVEPGADPPVTEEETIVSVPEDIETVTISDTHDDVQLRAPRQLSTMHYASFLPQESKQASQEDIDRLIGWIQAAAAVWISRNRGVELQANEATEEELDIVYGVGELALQQLVRSVLIKEVGIQAYYLGDRGMDRDDLMSHGLLGGLKAIDYYHSRQGGSFRSYARSFIKGAMRHALRDEMPVIHLPRRKHEELQKIRQVQHSKQDATADYIAKELNMEVSEVHAVLDAGDRILMSFNAMTFEPVIGAKSAPSESPKQHACLHKALAALSTKEADAIRLRFGISDEVGDEGPTAPRPVDDVAAAMGLSRSRVEVLLRTAKDKLRGNLDDATDYSK